MSEHKAYLQGHWKTVIFAELLITVSEIAGIVCCLYFKKQLSSFTLPLVLIADLLFLSPLKAGRAFLYDTLAMRNTQVRLNLMFRYYVHGYLKTIKWRVGLWIRYTFLFTLTTAPAAFSFVFRSISVESGITSQSDLLYLGLTFIGLIILIGGFIFALIFLIRYEVSSFLLPYRRRCRTLFVDSAKLCKKKNEVLLSIRFHYLRWLLLSWAVVPYFYSTAIYHMEQAIEIRRMLGKFPEKKSPQALQHGKNHDMISKIS